MVKTEVAMARCGIGVAQAGKHTVAPQARHVERLGALIGGNLLAPG